MRTVPFGQERYRISAKLHGGQRRQRYRGLRVRARQRQLRPCGPCMLGEGRKVRVLSDPVHVARFLFCECRVMAHLISSHVTDFIPQGGVIYARCDILNTEYIAVEYTYIGVRYA